VFPEPKKSEKVLGYVRIGQSVRVRDRTPHPGAGCPGGFVAVEPFGWVCLDIAATLDSDDRYVRALAELAPQPGPLPFEYALSNGTPMYRRLPSQDEWQKTERFYGRAGSHAPLSWGNRGHEMLAETRAISPNAAVPFFLADGGSASSPKARELVRREIPLGSMLAYRGVVAHEGRSFLLSADGTVVPADRVRPIRPSSFRGVELGPNVDLPLAWIKGQPRPKYRQREDGSLVPTSQVWALRSWVALDPNARPIEHGGRQFRATRERAAGATLFVAENDATVVSLPTALPWGVTENDRWILVSISAGTLVAYLGRHAAYATLISPGAGGIPQRGQDPVKQSTTPLGIYRITFKHRATTMSPEQGEHRKFWIADVPHTQYFNAPFALHAAYWHDGFGAPMSAGCINLSPIDAEWLFDWTEPHVPPEWNGAAPSSLTGPGTFVVVVR
jgi:hypothetical protein